MIATSTAKRARRSRSRPTTAEQDPARRDALLAQHVGLVHHVARQLANRLSTQADLDELVGAGMFGLIQAVDSFDAMRGLSFSTYAVPRIRGAMLDELRRQDHVPRNVRRRTRDLSRAREVLAGALRRRPREDELAHLLQVPPDMLRKWEMDAEGAALHSLNQPIRAEAADITLGDTLADDRVVALDELLTHEQEVARLKDAIADLKPQERTVLALNYFEELRLQEIATVLGLSVCRISQIRSAALAKLRVSLSALRAA